MKQVVIIGAGGHGREVAEILRHASEVDGTLEALGFVDDDPHRQGQVIDELPVLGTWKWFEQVDRDQIGVICAVGTPHICRMLVQRARSLQLSFVNIISPLAHISSRATIGQGVAVFPNTVINTGASLGNYSILNLGATVSHDSKVGAYCNINPGARLAGNVTIGEGCYIGMGTNVIQGCSVGAWATIGAGAVVTCDLLPNVTAVGIPARVIKTKQEGWYEQ